LINSLKDLEKLVKLCRAKGIESMTIGDITFKLGELPPTTRKQQKLVEYPISDVNHVYVPGGVNADTHIDTPNELTEDQMLMWSSAPGGIQSGEQL
jgi:hypothetical protein